MKRGLALIGAVSLIWLLGIAKPTVGIVTMAAFIVGYGTARMNDADRP